MFLIVSFFSLRFVIRNDALISVRWPLGFHGRGIGRARAAFALAGDNRREAVRLCACTTWGMGSVSYEVRL